MNIQKFKELLSVPSKTYQEEDMVEYLCNELDTIPGVSYYRDDMMNIYATKGKLNEELADELQHQLVPDKYAKGALPKTNLGKGTGKMFIFLNNVKMTPDQFIDKVQEDKAGGYCHTIKTYEYNNRVLLATKITITTDIGPCKKKTNPNPEPQKKETKPDGCPVDSSQWYENVLKNGGTPFNWSNVVPRLTISKAVACKCFRNHSDSSYYRRLQKQGGRCGEDTNPKPIGGGQG